MQTPGDTRGCHGLTGDCPPVRNSQPRTTPPSKYRDRKDKISKKKRHQKCASVSKEFNWAPVVKPTLPTDTDVPIGDPGDASVTSRPPPVDSNDTALPSQSQQNVNPNPRIVCLDQLGLTPNAFKEAGGVSEFIRDSSHSSPTRPFPSLNRSVQHRSVYLQKINSLCDQDGDFSPLFESRKTPPVSPYIAAYRRKVYRIKPESDCEQEPNISLPTQSIEGSCRCKISNCLKLYCDCFKSLRACSRHCNCVGCDNQTDNDTIRLQAMRKVLDSKYGKSRFQSVTVGEGESEPMEVTASTNSMAVFRLEEVACQCSKSGCSNKYCGCHSRGGNVGSLVCV